MLSPRALTSLDWMPPTPDPGMVTLANIPERGFEEWLTERLAIEHKVFFAQLQSSHETLQADVLQAYHQSLHVDSYKKLAQTGPLTSTVPMERSKTLDTLRPQATIVQGSPVAIVIEPRGSPVLSTVSVHKESPAIRSLTDTNSTTSTEYVSHMTRHPSWADFHSSWHRWEAVCGAMILLNAAVMLVEEQYRGLEVGFALGMKGFNEPATNVFPYALTMFNVLNVFFTVIFTFELMYRVYHDKLRVFKSFWIWFDIVVVLGSWISVFSIGVKSGFRPSSLRLIRLVRLFALVEVMECFEKLHLMIRSIQASLGALLWCMLLIMFTQVVATLCLHFLLAGVYDDLSIPENVRQSIFERFGTTARTMLTMFQVIFSNWSQPCWLLVLNVSEWYGLFFVLYRCVLGFALLKVVSSMFIAETHKICKHDVEIADLKKKSDSERHKRDLRQLFRKVDESGDGKVSWREMQIMLGNQQLVTWVKKMGINPLHLTELFKIIMKGGEHVEDGYVILDEFVSGMLKVEGAVRSIDILAVMKSVEKLGAKIDSNDLLHSSPFKSILV